MYTLLLTCYTLQRLGPTCGQREVRFSRYLHGFHGAMKTGSRSSVSPATPQCRGNPHLHSVKRERDDAISSVNNVMEMYCWI